MTNESLWWCLIFMGWSFACYGWGVYIGWLQWGRKS